MIKSLKDARLVDGIPAIVAESGWVRAASKALGTAHETTLRLADESQVFTSIDTASEEVLDALAVCWDIGWYDSTYTLAEKRTVIKEALRVHRRKGTRKAVEEAVGAVMPSAKLAEWFEYGGTPGCFRLEIPNMHNKGPKQYDITASIETVKRVSTHLDGVYRVQRPDLCICTAGVGKTVLRLKGAMDDGETAGITWLAEEHGDPLADQETNILCV